MFWQSELMKETMLAGHCKLLWPCPHTTQTYILAASQNGPFYGPNTIIVTSNRIIWAFGRLHPPPRTLPAGSFQLEAVVQHVAYIVIPTVAALSAVVMQCRQVVDRPKQPQCPRPDLCQAQSFLAIWKLPKLVQQLSACQLPDRTTLLLSWY